MKSLAKLAAAISLLGLAGIVSADPMSVISCSNDVTVNDSIADSCGQDVDNDSAAEANENFDMAPDLWVLGARYEADDGAFESNAIGVALFDAILSAGELFSGAFSIGGFYDPLLIVVKGGTSDSFYYLFDPVNPTTTCAGPDADPICGSYGNLRLLGPKGQLQGISHVSWYVKDKLDVPEPGTLGLLGIGLIGIGFARRRKTMA